MVKEELIKKLNEKVETTIRFIKEVLSPRRETTKILLNEFEDVLINFQKERDINILKKLREIDSRPTTEGATTDYTVGISLPLDGKYMSLSELVLEIEDLVFEMENN